MSRKVNRIARHLAHVVCKDIATNRPAAAKLLSISLEEYKAWELQAEKLKAKGYNEYQIARSLPVVTGGKVQVEARKGERSRNMVAKKTTAKKAAKTSSKGKAKKAAKKGRKSGRGQAVVVYFNTSRLNVLAAAKKYAVKNEQSLAEVVASALTAFLKK